MLVPLMWTSMGPWMVPHPRWEVAQRAHPRALSPGALAPR